MHPTTVREHIIKMSAQLDQIQVELQELTVRHEEMGKKIQEHDRNWTLLKFLGVPGTSVLSGVIGALAKSWFS